MNIINFLKQCSWNSYSEINPVITHAGSLTQLLRASTQNQIKQIVNKNQWEAALADEINFLSLHSSKEPTWIRETSWVYDNRCWVLTRVVIPETTLTPSQGKKLIAKPQASLGEILFADPSLTRSSFEFASFTHEAEIFQARRSILYFYQLPLLITELFLPAFFTHFSEQQSYV